MVYRGATETGGLPNTAVDILRDCYMIRVELRGGNVWYELAHDRLVEPVRQDNLAWKASYRNPVSEGLERGPDSLLTGMVLAAALRYARDSPQDLTPEERRFLKRSEIEERKAATRRKALTGAAIAVILLLSILTAWALKNATDARKSAAEAEREVTIARARRLATTALLNRAGQLDLAALLSIEGRRALDTFETRSSLLSTLVQASDSGLISVLHQSGSISCIAYSRDGKLLASGGAGGVRLWDVARRESLGVPLTQADVTYLAFSPDGRMLVTVGEGSAKTVRLWDVSTRQLLGEVQDGHRPNQGEEVMGAAFSPDGTLLALVGFDYLRLWDVGKKQLKGESRKGVSLATRVAFSPDGKLLASAGLGPAATVQLWDVSTVQLTGTLDTRLGFLTSLAFSPNGKLLASGGDGGTALFDINQRRRLSDPLVDSTTVEDVEFSPDGKLLASASAGGVRLWDTGTRQLVSEPLSGHSGEVMSVAFRPDGKVLASAGRDATIRLWDLAMQHQLSDVLPGNRGEIAAGVAFSPDGKLLTSASYESPLQIWDVRKHQPFVPPLKHEGAVSSLAFSPDGKLLAVPLVRWGTPTPFVEFGAVRQCSYGTWRHFGLWVLRSYTRKVSLQARCSALMANCWLRLVPTLRCGFGMLPRTSPLATRSFEQVMV